MFTGADWLVVIGAVGAAAATVLGAWLAHSRSPHVEDPEPAPAAPSQYRLHPADRQLIARLMDIISRSVTRLEDALAQHRRAIEDNTDNLERSRKDD